MDSQLEQLRKAGCTSRNIYREKVTGARADRRELNRMLGKLAPGDVVTVTRIDRLARSTFDLFAIVKRIVDAKAQFRSLAEPWADTGTSTGRLMLAVLGGLADVERDLICTRTAEGRARQGPRKGRGPSPFPPPSQKKEAIRRRAQGATLDELARSYNVSRATISRSPRDARRQRGIIGASTGTRTRGGSVDSGGKISITKDCSEEPTRADPKFVSVASGLLMVSCSTSFGR